MVCVVVAECSDLGKLLAVLPCDGDEDVSRWESECVGNVAAFSKKTIVSCTCRPGACERGSKQTQEPSMET